MPKKEPTKKPSTKQSSSKSTSQTASLLQYRGNVAKITKTIKDFALKTSDNLLTVKMALWGAAREVESMLRERRK